MKKLFFAALIALAGFTACGTKNVETAATEATEQREVGGGDIAYVQVEAVLAQSDLYNAEGIALKDKTEKAQKSWAQKLKWAKTK
jgi:outer membrane protein